MLDGTVEHANSIKTEGLRPSPPNQSPEYDTKPSDGEVPVTAQLEFELI